MIALEPYDLCLITAALSYEHGRSLAVLPMFGEDNPRDDQGVIERHFDQRLEKILDAIFQRCARAGNGGASPEGGELMDDAENRFPEGTSFSGAQIVRSNDATTHPTLAFGSRTTRPPIVRWYR
jgi:hypothetical protein